MKNKYNLRLAILLLVLLFSNYSNAQFLIKSSTKTINDLNSVQLANYNRFVDPDYYSAYSIVEIGDYANSQLNGIVKINLPTIGIPDLSYKVGYVEYENSNTYFIHAQETQDNEYLNSVVSWQTFKGVTMANLTLPGKDYDIYDLGDGLAVLAQSTESNNGSICIDPATQEDALNSDPVWIDPCLGAILKLQIIYNNAVLNKYGLPMVLTKANFCVNQLNAIRKNSGNLAKIKLQAVENVNIVQNNSADPEDDITLDLNDLVNDATIQNLRNTNIADLTVLLVKKPYKGSGMEIFGSIAPNGFTDEINAYAIVNFKTATGKLRTFAHEVGHLFDARHNLDNSGQPYSHAHCLSNCSEDCGDNQHTIMYRFGCAEVVDFYSTPFKFFGAAPVGVVNTAHNARRIGERDLPVSLYRADPALPLYIDLTIDPFSQCELSGFAESKVKCGTPPYSYNYEYSLDGINWYSAGTNINASTIDNQSITLFIPPNNGIYTSSLYRVTVTDANSNTATDIQLASSWCKGQGSSWFIQIDDPNAPRLANPNKSKNIAQITSSDFSLFPNPSKGFFTIGAPDLFINSKTQYEILDIAGKLVLIGEAIINELATIEINTGNLVNGIYSIKLTIKGNVYEKKFATQN